MAAMEIKASVRAIPVTWFPSGQLECCNQRLNKSLATSIRPTIADQSTVAQQLDAKRRALTRGGRSDGGFRSLTAPLLSGFDGVKTVSGRSRPHLPRSG